MSRLIDKWRKWILPGFRSGHTLYTERLKSIFRDGWRWLDAGGGWHVFCDLYDGEVELVARAKRAVVCDSNAEALSKHVSISERVCCDITKIPLEDKAFDFVTLSMVVEHLPEPQKCFKELARVLDWDGTLMIHTVNLWSYPTMIALLAHVIPVGLRIRTIALVTGREPDDIFPTFYRCNTRRTMIKQMKDAGLEVEEIRYLASGPIFEAVPPIAALEMLFVRMTQTRLFSGMRSQLLVTARKRRPVTARRESQVLEAAHSA